MKEGRKNFGKFTLVGAIIGFVIGIILAIVNIFLSGTLGYLLLYPLFNIINLLVGFGQLFNCTGEGCWLAMIIVGSIGFIFFLTLIFTLIGYLLDKLKNKK